MPLMRCELKSIRSMAQLYDELSRQLALPKQMGRNLDALWDVLSTDVEGPIEIVWPTAQQDRITLGKQGEAVFDLLNDLADERDDVTLKLG